MSNEEMEEERFALFKTQIISFIGEQVPSETDIIYAFSRFHGYFNSLWVFLVQFDKI